MENTRSRESKRLLGVDALRGLAALYVLVFHYIAFYHTSLGAKAFDLPVYVTGIYGVMLFFIISGYVIFMTLERASRPMDFIVSRGSRLFPAYWAAVILATFIIKRYYVHEYWTSPNDILMNFSMMQGWFGFKNLDGVFWTLSIELTFYIAMFTLYLTKQLRRVEIFGSLWLLCMLLHELFPVGPIKFMDISNHLDFGNLFFAGILFYRINKEGPSAFRLILLGLCLAMQVVIRIPIHSGYMALPLLTTAVVASFFAVFYLASKNRLRFLESPVLVFFGIISYSLYLTHSHLSLVMIRYMVVYEYPLLFVFVLPFIVSIILAVILTYAVEHPAQKWIRSIYKRQKNPVSHHTTQGSHSLASK